MGKIEQQVIQDMSIEALAWGSEAHRHDSFKALEVGDRSLAGRHFNRAVDMLLAANGRANEYASVIAEVKTILNK
ncbi:hypothetical protein HYW44_04795 [Candidatus Daviesbacteria bacterium]|nr:hypothetical protein [Candidatus Daviesbacteria bacterium]